MPIQLTVLWHKSWSRAGGGVAGEWNCVAETQALRKLKVGWLKSQQHRTAGRPRWHLWWPIKSDQLPPVMAVQSQRGEWGELATAAPANGYIYLSCHPHKVSLFVRSFVHPIHQHKLMNHCRWSCHEPGGLCLDLLSSLIVEIISCGIGIRFYK